MVKEICQMSPMRIDPYTLGTREGSDVTITSPPQSWYVLLMLYLYPKVYDLPFFLNKTPLIKGFRQIELINQLKINLDGQK